MQSYYRHYCVNRRLWLYQFSFYKVTGNYWYHAYISAAGLVTGNKSFKEGTSDITHDYINKFWEMMDEILNAILFLLIVFEMLIIPFNQTLFSGCITNGTRASKHLII